MATRVGVLQASKKKDCQVQVVRASFTSVTAVIFAHKLFPDKTPQRYKLIAEFVKKTIDNDSEHPLYICVGEATQTDHPQDFACNPVYCKLLFSLLEKYHPSILNYHEIQETLSFSDPSRSSFKPIVLLPPNCKKSCCGKTISIGLTLALIHTPILVFVHGGI